jgi:cytochrome c5
MKKKIMILGLLVSSIVLVQCTSSKKASTSSTPAVAKADDIPAWKLDERLKISASEMEHGKMLYESKCGKCHKLHEVNKFSYDKWNKVLARMVPKAKLEGDDAKHVEGYVLRCKFVV